jgi:tRNA A37 threonylcarbamoyladenosine synthetase subunit TsaC/SUA5/YrdC
VPDHAICIELVKGLGRPILSTSAKSLENTNFLDPSLIHDYFGKRIDVVIDGGSVPGQPSSVISLIGDEPRIIRKGLGDVFSFE